MTFNPPDLFRLADLLLAWNIIIPPKAMLRRQILLIITITIKAIAHIRPIPKTSILLTTRGPWLADGGNSAKLSSRRMVRGGVRRVGRGYGEVYLSLWRQSA